MNLLFELNLSVGITIGDIGAKFSSTFNGNDNGYLMFDRVRIPLNQMLMRLAKVKQGQQRRSCSCPYILQCGYCYHGHPDHS